MPYSAEISRANPTCFLFLIDRSKSMAGPISGEGDAGRIVYFHVPMAWDAFLAFSVVFGASIAYLRSGNPRDVIVQVATSMQADLLILGSHSKRGLLDIVLGGTAQHVSKSAPCLVVLVSPKKEGV